MPSRPAVQEETEIADQSELNTHKIADDDPEVSSGQKESVDPMIGYVLDGRYELLEAIGSGGMSIVYKARLNTVNKLFAIKTLNIQVQAKDNVKERFHREIDLLLKLEHPHIVSVQDCLYGPNNQPYLVMDLLRGVSLEQELQRSGPMPAECVRKIMIQVCAALKYAHQHSVVHRDLKPGNIMLLENEVDFVKVLDFGLALIGENTRKITQSGEFWGSPPYASPEQVKGDVTDARSDIYSLGCVMYELLTGKDPFHGAGLYELLSKHVNETPEPLAVTYPDSKVTPEMERLVFKCMEKKAQDRFQTVADLQYALEAIGSGSFATDSSSPQTVSVSRPRAGTSSSKKAPSAEPSSYTITIAVVLAVLLIAVFSLMHVAGKNHERPGSFARSETKANQSQSEVSASELQPEKTRPPTVKNIAPKVVVHTQHSESPVRNVPAGHIKHSAPAHEPKQAATPKASPKRDPFALMREHLSKDAKNEK